MMTACSEGSAESRCRWYIGVVVRIAYIASVRERDHVTVRQPDGTLVDTYRCIVHEIGAQECAEPGESVRRAPEVFLSLWGSHHGSQKA